MKTTYNKAMIEIVYEVRRRVPSNLKPAIKLANPELLNELIAYYQTANDAILKALIKELMVLAGPEWESELISSNIYDQEKKHRVKSYRGSVSIEEIPNVNPAIIEVNVPELIYRGQVVRR